MKRPPPHAPSGGVSFRPFNAFRNVWVRVAMIAAVTLTTAAAASDSSDAAAFQAQLQSAMARMMSGMDDAPSGDIDADFVTMMEPHHQGAIDMAVAELRYGKNEQLRRIAQEIIIDQQQEIAAMRIAIGRPIPPSAPAATTVAPTEPPIQHLHHGAAPK